MICHCGLNEDFKKCCEPLILKKKQAITAEQLMRSRYSAYCCKNMNYIYETTDPQARAEFDHKGNEEWANKANFEKLEIIKTEESANKALVEFKATFKLDDEIHIHHELSTFRKNKGEWFFRNGRSIPLPVSATQKETETKTKQPSKK